MRRFLNLGSVLKTLAYYCRIYCIWYEVKYFTQQNNLVQNLTRLYSLGLFGFFKALKEQFVLPLELFQVQLVLSYGVQLGLYFIVVKGKILF